MKERQMQLLFICYLVVVCMPRFSHMPEGLICAYLISSGNISCMFRTRTTKQKHLTGHLIYIDSH